MVRRCVSWKILAGAALVLASSTANAAIVTYFGADAGVGPPGPYPNSDAQAAAFDAAVGAHDTITFEGLPTGDFTSLLVAPGVTATRTNLYPFLAAGINDTDRPGGVPTGFNTTPGGSQWLGIGPNANDPVGGSVTFSFANPIRAFGAYFTDTESNYPEQLTVTFNDGTARSLDVTKNPFGGGASFFGFTDFGTAISSVTINTGGGTGDNRDFFGLDDVRFVAVPEPASWLLVGGGILGLFRLRRRRSR